MKTLDHTVHATSGSAAAVTRSTPVGTGITWPAGTATCSAYPPPASSAHTSSPTDQPVDALAERGDRAAALQPDDVRRPGRRRVEALPLQDVGAVDRRGRDVDQHLARAGLGSGTSATVRTSGPPGSVAMTARMPPA